MSILTCLEYRTVKLYRKTQQEYGELVHICNWRLSLMQVVAGLPQCPDGKV